MRLSAPRCVTFADLAIMAADAIGRQDQLERDL